MCCSALGGSANSVGGLEEEGWERLCGAEIEASIFLVLSLFVDIGNSE